MPHSRERALDRICRSEVLPVLGRKVIEGEQWVAIFAEALDSLLVLEAVALDEAIECSLGVLPGLRHPDVLQRTLGLCLQALGQLVQDIRRLVQSETQTRTYWWCSPPKSGTGTMRPAFRTVRGIGASFCSDRCVRT